MLGRYDSSSQTVKVPDGWRIYTVGDVHGCAQLLRVLRGVIAADLSNSPARNSLTIFLGDYIDRGMDSRDVIQILSSEPFPTPILPLSGNHEAMLLAFLRGMDEDGLWIENGGLETLHSYGVDISNVRYRQGMYKAATDLANLLPANHKSFLLSLKLTCVAGDYFFCHAGVRPGVPLQQQRKDDLLWIREEFLQSSSQYEKIIVHGHTPVREPEIRPNRINVDTGAYMTGVLSCLVLEGNTHRFLTADSSQIRGSMSTDRLAR